MPMFLVLSFSLFAISALDGLFALQPVRPVTSEATAILGSVTGVHCWEGPLDGAGCVFGRWLRGGMLGSWDSRLIPRHSRGAWRALREPDSAQQLRDLFFPDLQQR